MKANERGYRILIVDDDTALRETVGRHLQRSGFTVVTAADAENALQLALASEVPFDVVLTDLHMPGMDGIELMVALRTRRPSQCVVIVSGHDDEAFEESALANGAADYLLKPFELSELAAVVTKAIAART